MARGGWSGGLLTGVVVVMHAVVWFWRSRVVTEPYMDEAFHIPQTQEYCQGRFDQWDDKITTFPGLYLVMAVPSLVVRWASTVFPSSSPVHASLGFLLCSVKGLRLCNGLVFGGLSALLSFEILGEVHPGISSEDAFLNALAINLFPVYFFSADLYYTDAGSLALVLLALLLALRRRHRASGVAAVGAVLFRQTNVVWAAFVLAYDLHSQVNPKGRSGGLLGLPRDLGRVLRGAWVHRARLARNNWITVALMAAFAAFVAKNGGVVVGDRDAHKPKLHLAQFLYCCTAVAGAHFLVHFDPRSPFVRALSGASKARVLLIAAPLLAAFCLVIRRYTLVHPYTLADNRHYTFYVWKNYLGRSEVHRVALAPLHLFSAGSLVHRLARTQPPLVVLAAFACAAATTALAELLEFRYYITFYAIHSLLSEPMSRTKAAGTCAAFLAANVALEAVFLFRPFTWPDGSVARFMW
ncbi:alpha-1,2-glucosyltransferase [Chloropicon primus]|nr:alpha-1,2-glucosyltransferase [Chloropicon primus]